MLQCTEEALDDVIGCLLALQTDESDVHRQETLRVLLQLVVGYTPDDAGF